MYLIFSEKLGRREKNVSISLFHCLEVPLGQGFCSLLPLYHHSFIHLLHKYLLSAYGVSGIVLGLGKMLNMVNKQCPGHFTMLLNDSCGRHSKGRSTGG